MNLFRDGFACTSFKYKFSSMSGKTIIMNGSVQKGTLTIVGTGIKLGEHLTQESLFAIKNAEKVFAVVADAATLHWLKTLNSQVESLHVFYDEDKDRLETYQQMIETIADSVIQGAKTCAIFYGHPGVFVFPSHEVINKLQRLGYSAKMLPGLSADACLYADLGVDPAKDGCQSFEATDFLLFNRTIDPSVGCLLWQVGVIAEFKGKSTFSEDARFQIFVDELEKYYPSTHQVTLYEAAQFKIFEAKIITVSISELRQTKVSTLSTLYIPPANKKRINHEIAKLLQVDTARFT
jgi:uncharacterized protein YabN with tetrapyrrole methylase and pyrophosphatase domain